MGDSKETGNSYLPATFQARKDIALSPDGLSDSQRTQFNNATRSYLREFKLEANFANLRKAAAVALECMYGGLEKRTIGPSDTLNAAFTKGYGERKKWLQALQYYNDDLEGESDFVGTFAVPQEVAAKARAEKSNYIFDPYLSESKSFLRTVSQRRPHRDHLQGIAKDAIAEQIPTADFSQLTRKQEAGLMRNLLFSVVTNDEKQPLVDINDLIRHSSLYIEAVDANLDDVSISVAGKLGIEDGAGILYIKDLLRQMKSSLQAVPSPTSGVNIQDIHVAYASLRSSFLIDNPFDRFPLLTIEREAENSIWQDMYTQVVEVDGVQYRVPKPEVLEVMSFQNKGRVDHRSSDLMHAADAVRNIQYDKATIVKIDQEIDALTQSLETYDIPRLERLKPAIQRRDPHLDIWMKKDTVTHISEVQRNTVSDYRTFVTEVGGIYGSYKKEVAELAEKYSDLTKVVTHRDKRRISQITGRVRKMEEYLFDFFINDLYGKMISQGKLYTETDFLRHIAASGNSFHEAQVFLEKLREGSVHESFEAYTQALLNEYFLPPRLPLTREQELDLANKEVQVRIKEFKQKLAANRYFYNPEKYPYFFDWINAMQKEKDFPDDGWIITTTKILEKALKDLQNDRVPSFFNFQDSTKLWAQRRTEAYGKFTRSWQLPSRSWKKRTERLKLDTLSPSEKDNEELSVQLNGHARFELGELIGNVLLAEELLEPQMQFPTLEEYLIFPRKYLYFVDENKNFDSSESSRIRKSVYDKYLGQLKGEAYQKLDELGIVLSDRVADRSFKHMLENGANLKLRLGTLRALTPDILTWLDSIAQNLDSFDKASPPYLSIPVSKVLKSYEEKVDSKRRLISRKKAERENVFQRRLTQLSHYGLVLTEDEYQHHQARRGKAHS